MSMNDTLANALSHLLNCERIGKTECTIKNVSKVIEKVLEILNKNRYLGKSKISKSSKGQKLSIELKGTINNCGTIKPRFPVKLSDYEKFERRYLPAKDFGILIVSTTKGMMTHTEAIEKKLGGKLIAYCY